MSKAQQPGGLSNAVTRAEKMVWEEQWVQCCRHLSQWQELWRNVGLPEGGEYESQVIAELPSTAEILNMARQRLRMQTDDNDV